MLDTSENIKNTIRELEEFLEEMCSTEKTEEYEENMDFSYLDD